MLDTQRHLYNAALEERIDCCWKTGKTLTYFDQAKSLTVCRRALPDMAAVPTAIQRGILKRLDHAFKGFFQRVRQSGAGFPRFQGRRHFNSLSVVSGVKVEGNRLRIPGSGWLSIRRRGGNPWPKGEPVSAVLKREDGRWKAVVCYAVSAPEPEDNGHVIGVDMNAGALATSEGEIMRLPESRRLEARARRYRKQLARQRRGSRRREKTRRQLSKTTRHMAMKRHDWQHHVSRRLADATGTVVVEDLKVRNMTRSAKGTKEEPGRNVRSRAGLNRVILETGRSSFRRMLDYKAHRVIALNPAYTSQTCAACGAQAPNHARRGTDFNVCLWPCGSCRPQCSGKHTGLGDWGICAGRLPGCRACEPRNRSKEGSMTLSTYRYKSQLPLGKCTRCATRVTAAARS